MIFQAMAIPAIGSNRFPTSSMIQCHAKGSEPSRLSRQALGKLGKQQASQLLRKVRSKSCNHLLRCKKPNNQWEKQPKLNWRVIAGFRTNHRQYHSLTSKINKN